ncbi:MAG: polymer-forming cytoskeletal protein [Alphaproteobacteria bacterium]|nr:polymer-forming cytoskeletal protein [Alphaproteobacteria bacterium]MDP6566765.1 polymer-forming cytoskeletal protein [Alphaproteobacteria bacterium]MDP6812975.1 polymer-forming cytoskeletal protein [Alphaproteobacteria bacterium]
MKKTKGQVRAAPSLISTDLSITGNLQTPGEVQLDGTVDGDVGCGKLMIGEKAMVSGEITADEVVVRGRVTGRIKARTVQLTKSAKVIGDIWHDTLAIEAGAYLEGHCKRNDAAQSADITTHQAVSTEATPARKADVITARIAGS